MEPYVISAVAFAIKAALWGGLALWGVALGRRVFDAYRDPDASPYERAWGHRVQLLLFVVVTLALGSVSQGEYGYRPQTTLDAPDYDERMEQVDREAREAASVVIPEAEGDREAEALMSEEVIEENQRENRESVEAFRELPDAE